MSNITRLSRVLPAVSALCAAALRAAACGAAAATQGTPTPTHLAVTKGLGALLLLLPLAACTDRSLTEMLNGGSASATSPAATPYQVGNTATAAELTRLKNYAAGQNTYEMHHVLGTPDSYDREHDYYRTDDGGMIAVQYDSQGKWTGKTESVPAPQWEASRYPGGQP